MKKKFQKFIEKNRWLRFVPTTLTICNSLCGFGAILYTLYAYDADCPKAPEQALAVSAWIVIAAMLFDALDGFAARIFNAASIHGLQMDSLSDMVTFGVAPAVIVAVMAHTLRDLKPYQYLMIWLFCGVYLGCAALRLATYNIHAMLEKKSGDKFSGLPTPGAAAAVCSLVIFYGSKHNQIIQILAILPFYTAFLGFLMVSNIKYQHMGRWMQSVRRNRNRAILFFITLIIFSLNPKLVTVILVNGYVISAPLIVGGKKISSFLST